MSTFITTLVASNERVVNRRDGSGTFTLHEVTDQQGVKWTVRRDIAQLAQGYMNQPVEVVTRTEQNGQYTNRYLDHLAPINHAAPAAPVVQAQQAQQTYVPASTSPTPPLAQPSATPPSGVVSDRERQTFIMRQTAAKVAAELSKTSSEYWQNCQDLLHYFETGVTPDDIPF